jgi:alpha-D-ribose 1-methylphosphonate 5-triphosphate synthase subunit PhnH
MVAVPAVMPVTLPVEPTVATLVEPELHIPPPEPSVTLIIDPAHTLKGPVIVPASGNGLTVTTVVALALPQLTVTV